MVGWGDNTYSQLNIPASVNGTSDTASAIAAGNGWNCAIQIGTGAVVCWGGVGIDYGETTPPPSVNGTSGSATAIAAGNVHACAIQSGTGAVICWGANGNISPSEATPPPGSVNGTSGTATAIAAGDDTLAIGQRASLYVEWLPVAYPGNAADNPANCFGSSCGSVAYRYDISEYETTNAQYADLLNWKARSDPLGLYDPRMGSNANSGGITQSGVSGFFSYAIKPGFESKPVTYASFYSALRFANWLNNGAGWVGDTETGSYTLLGGIPIPSNATSIARNLGANIYLAGENEWYKAAYYSPAGVYFAYSFGTNAPTTCAAPSATPNTANCFFSVRHVTDVGAYTGSRSPFGTFDQGGNLEEWTDEIISTLLFTIVRGSAWNDQARYLAAGSIESFPSSGAESTVGFRVVRVPPVPSCGLGSELVLILPPLMWLRGRRRRRRE